MKFLLARYAMYEPKAEAMEHRCAGVTMSWWLKYYAENKINLERALEKGEIERALEIVADAAATYASLDFRVSYKISFPFAAEVREYEKRYLRDILQAHKTEWATSP